MSEPHLVAEISEAVTEMAVLAAVGATSVIFLEEARMLLEKILSGKGESYA